MENFIESVKEKIDNMTAREFYEMLDNYNYDKIEAEIYVIQVINPNYKRYDDENTLYFVSSLDYTE